MPVKRRRLRFNFRDLVEMMADSDAKFVSGANGNEIGQRSQRSYCRQKSRKRNSHQNHLEAIAKFRVLVWMAQSWHAWSFEVFGADGK
jgi:hypothetical protein